MRLIPFSMAILGLTVPLLTLDNHKTSTNSTLERAIAAIGEEGLSKLWNVTYECQRIYRSRGLMQSYNLMRADVSAATSGTQNISYEVDYPLLRQRIDRRIQPSPALANKLATEALMMSPGLVERIKIRRSISSEEREVDINGIIFPADIPTIYRPLRRTTSDLRKRDKRRIPIKLQRSTGNQISHTIQTIYSSSSQRLSVVLEDFVIDKINATSKFSNKLFDLVLHGQKANISEKPPGVPSGLVTDYSTSLLGSPVKNVSVDALKSSRPVDLLQVYWLIIDDSHDLGFNEAVLEWIERNIGKKVTYVAPSHHHRDHSGGVADYVRAGAKLIIPEMAVDYWSSIPGAQFITFNQTHPYVHRDNKVQAWFNWADQAPHASDWTYVMVTERCPNTSSSIFVFEANTCEAGLSVDLGNQQQMRQWLDQLLDDGLPRSTTVMPMHGWITPSEQLINITAYQYPDFDISRWRKGAALCDKSPTRKHKDN
ncbi:uncharacterized protein LW94_7929 [Fusarium fujikuroi]|nr:uncharacterized protein LW94_7929 [Fusarium fujikuroi]